MADVFAKAFVAGHPIAHSRSPLIHRHWLQRYEIRGSYEPVEVAPEEFSRFLEGLARAGYRGGNVTLPHKGAAFANVERRDAAAEAIGAVNTLWFEAGRLCGGNTDSYGFAANLDQQAPAWRKAGCALVLGAGGAARAVVHALAAAGLAEIRIANRTRTRADDLAHHFGAPCAAADWSEIDRAAVGAGLVVNTTSLGMRGAPGPALDMQALPAKAVVADIVYAPLETPLLNAARAAGLTVVDGLGMLLHQAVPGFERWFGVRPAVTRALRDLVVADLEAAA